MALEQQLERSEALLEVNEQNRQEVERSRQREQQAQNQVRVSAARVQNCQLQLQQAVAAKNAAQQQAAGDDGGSGSVSPSYDAEIARAQSELSAANMELQAAYREQTRAREELERAEDTHRESAGRLRGEMQGLQEIARKYGLEMSKTQALMNTPEGRVASMLYERLGMGREKVNDLRRRIAASLGIAASPEGISGSAGAGGVGIRGKALPRQGGGGDPGVSSASGEAGGYRNPYVKTTFTTPVTYRDPATGQSVTKLSKRTVYENRNLDPAMTIPAGTRRGNGTTLKHDTTNIELMRDGKAPFVAVTRSDGSTGLVPLELHHLTGEETQYSSRFFHGEDRDGTLVEMAGDVHDRYDKPLHGVNAGTSFRKDGAGNRSADSYKYNEIRQLHWMDRARRYDAENG